jgi:hypothetical protein
VVIIDILPIRKTAETGIYRKDAVIHKRIDYVSGFENIKIFSEWPLQLWTFTFMILPRMIVFRVMGFTMGMGRKILYGVMRTLCHIFGMG